MGLFSWECPECLDSIISDSAINEGENELIGWQKRCAVVFSDGTTLVGEYDGYGRVHCDIGIVVNLTDALDPQTCDAPFTMYHEACYRAAGEPMFNGIPSRRAQDQGYFFNDPSERQLKPEE